MISHKSLHSPFVSIILPTRNNKKDLMDCLNSVWHLNHPLDCIDITIWDNNSRDETKKEVKAFLSRNIKEKSIQASFIENTDNLGGFTSRDELLKQINAKANFVLNIDDDVILPSDLLAKLIPLFQKDISVGIIGPRTVFDDDPSQTAHGAGFVNWWLGRHTDVDSKQMMECDYVIGCCMLIKREVISEVGGFDRDYYTSHGEVDFCLKAKKKGYKVVYCPDVVVRHRVEKGGTKTPERIYYLYRNKLFVIKKNAPVPQRWISYVLYSLFWFPKAIIDSIIRNNGIDYREIRVISRAMADGWLNRVGRRI